MSLIHRLTLTSWVAWNLMECSGFRLMDGNRFRSSSCCWPSRSSYEKGPRRRNPFPLSMAASPNFDSNNPYQVLGITDALPTKADIKRAYRKLAMKYHPDVADSTVDKNTASARFAKINAAYRDALERLERGETPRQTTTTTASGSGGWEPPHRRSGSYRPPSSSSRTSSNPYASTDWRDYMPNTEDSEMYDTDGDSFGKIFSDLFAQGATGSVSFVSDFLDFFESNFDGYKSESGSKIPDDPDLQAILRSGSVKEIKSEMEETELVVRQLSTKLGAIREELDPLRQAEALRYSERMRNQERIDELEAQQKVVDGYVKTAQQRLLTLQNRYKELKQQRSESSRTTSGSTWNEVRTEAAGSSKSYQSSSSSSSSRTNADPSSSNNSADTSWKSEGFGSYGRRSSNRRSRTTTGSSSPSPSAPPPSYSSPRNTEPPPSRVGKAQPSSSMSSGRTTIPPHRQTAASSYRDKVENERRLREIKVDEEFEKLKKELGLS